METQVKIENAKKDKDYFPSIFANKDGSIVILADGRTSDRTFSGMIIHSSSGAKNATIGVYSTGWTYAQFNRLPKGSNVVLTIKQED